MDSLTLTDPTPKSPSIPLPGPISAPTLVQGESSLSIHLSGDCLLVFDGWGRGQSGNDRINVGISVLLRRKRAGEEGKNWNLDMLHLTLRDKFETKLLMTLVLRDGLEVRGVVEIR